VVKLSSSLIKSMYRVLPRSDVEDLINFYEKKFGPVYKITGYVYETSLPFIGSLPRLPENLFYIRLDVNGKAFAIYKVGRYSSYSNLSLGIDKGLILFKSPLKNLEEKYTLEDLLFYNSTWLLCIGRGHRINGKAS